VMSAKALKPCAVSKRRNNLRPSKSV